jgi:hypothetical protein
LKHFLLLPPEALLSIPVSSWSNACNPCPTHRATSLLQKRSHKTTALLSKPLVNKYRDWIGCQRTAAESLNGRRRETTDKMLQIAGLAADRIEAGIPRLVSDPLAFEAFRIANRAMAAAGRRRVWIAEG